MTERSADPPPARRAPPADIRPAARATLKAQGQTATPAGRVTRAVLDVDIEGVTEVVTVMWRDGELRWSSTGSGLAATDAHSLAALATLASGAPAVVEAPQRPVGLRTTMPDGIGERSTPVEIKVGGDKPSVADTLAGALEDVLQSVVRVGVDEAARSPSVDESVERLVSALPAPLPTTAARWVQRLQQALRTADLQATVRLLGGASRLASDLRLSAPPLAAQRRLATWSGLGTADRAHVRRISDRTLVEVAHEYLPGAGGVVVQRRHLVCVDTGEMFREEGLQGDRSLSVGPCPRVVTVGLGEVEQTAPPRRLRLLQYAVSSTVTHDHWARLQGAAQSSFAAMTDEYRRTIRDYPGLCEPFVLVLPRRTELQDGVTFFDREGYALPLARANEPALGEAMRQLIGDHQPTWVAGRLLDAEGALLLSPSSVGLEAGGRRRVLRIR